MENLSIVEQSVWDDGYTQHEFSISDDPIMNDFITSHLSRKGGELLEVGCFPGRFLPVMASLGYTVSGIDLTQRVAELSLWLSSVGVTPGSFYHEDFCAWLPARQYDAVVSFGFIEHFMNWQEVFEKHCEIVAPGGTLLVTFPNFRGLLQYGLHKWLDAINLGRHHLPAMNIGEYEKICSKRGWNILYAGYWGGFDFWAHGHSQLTWAQRKTVGLLSRLKKVSSHIPSSRLYSPYAGIVACRPQ